MLDALGAYLEDLEDARIVSERLRNPAKPLSLEEVEKNLGLDVCGCLAGSRGKLPHVCRIEEHEVIVPLVAVGDRKNIHDKPVREPSTRWPN